MAAKTAFALGFGCRIDFFPVVHSCAMLCAPPKMLSVHLILPRKNSGTIKESECMLQMPLEQPQRNTKVTCVW